MSIGRRRNTASRRRSQAIQALIDGYLSGDPYLAFAKQAGAIPPDGTKATHARERTLFKTAVLAVGYGLEAASLAARVGISGLEARELLLHHRETYPRFWHWSDGYGRSGDAARELSTVFGWQVHAGRDANPRSLRNFPMQANGAEMMRIACCLATERGHPDLRARSRCGAYLGPG